MDTESGTKAGDMQDIPLVPAAAVGFLLYPYAVQLILGNPPANDPGQPPSSAR
jgi:hypothetical protein